MKLIVKEYLASLREREELDAILPDLLSQMGFNVFSRPSRGTRQAGVDIAAVGSLDGSPEKVYLFSIKSGNLTRDTWNGTTQALRPSLDEIKDVYIPTMLPSQHKGKPIVVCLCFGGDINEAVRIYVEGYIKQNSKDSITFDEWNGDRLAGYILNYFLREDLLPFEPKSFLRKSLALLDEPEVSYKHFCLLVNALKPSLAAKNTEILTAIRQLNICLWILFAWCRNANNLDAAYRAAELAMLYAWEIHKPFIGKNGKYARKINDTLDSIWQVYLQITSQYLNDKIFPYIDKLHALSHAVRSSSSIDINLKLFDLLSRIAISGFWSLYQNLQCYPQNDEQQRYMLIKQYSYNIKLLIRNNPMLFSPYKDEQVIDIALAVNFLLLDKNNYRDLHSWLSGITTFSISNFKTHRHYPSNISSYNELIEYPLEKSDSYRQEITAGSVLYPMLSIYAAVLRFDDIYVQLQNFKNDFLKHCNCQLWYPDSASEEYFYTNSSPHGGTLSSICIEKTQEELLGQVFKECQETPYFNEMSAVKEDFWPIILLGCRHYRLPVPLHFLHGMWINTSQK